MKQHAITLLFLATLVANTPAREFTDSLGRKLDADIVSVADSQVTLKRTADGQTFTVPVSTFSADDQTFISDFASSNIRYKFEVRYARTKLDAKKERSGNKQVEKETWAYKVDVRNLSTGPVNDVRVDYWCFRRRHEGKTRSDAELEVKGSYVIDNLARGSTTKFETNAVEINKETLDAGWYYVNGDKNKQSDAMGGLVVRIYKGDKEIYSYSTKDDLLAMTDMPVPQKMVR